MVMLVAREISPTTSSFLTCLAPRRHVCGFVRRALCVCEAEHRYSCRLTRGAQEAGGGRRRRFGGDRTISLLLLLLLLLRAIGW